MLGNIVERSTEAPQPPTAPRAPASSTAGFPTIIHRSQKAKRPSAFAAAASSRQQRAVISGKAIEAEDIPSLAPDTYNSRSAEAGPSRLPNNGGDQDEYARVQREVGDENRQRVEAMTEEERAQEITELQERFGAKALQALRRRAEKKAMGAQGENVITATSVEPSAAMSAVSEAVHPHATDDSTPLRRRSVRFDAPASPPRSISASGTSALGFAVPSEPNSSAMSPSGTDSEQPTIRFDLKGTLLSATQQADLPSHLGLHHHGDQPDLAGYTIGEVLWLCRSTVPAQRIGMMGLLAKIIRLSVLENDGVTEEVRTACKVGRVCEKAVALAVNVLQSLRNITLLQTAIELLYTALGGPTWSCGYADLRSRSDDILSFNAIADANGRAAPVSSVPFEDLLPRLSDLLTTPDLLPRSSITQLVLILRRTSYADRSTAETILALAPPLLQAHVIRRLWPPVAGSEPSVEFVRFTADLIASSRLCATELVDAGLPGSLLRFCVVSTWPDDSDLGVQLCTEVLRIYGRLARYGLSAGTARTANDIWVALGAYIKTRLPGRAVSLTAAYFALLEAWVTCATDPHRTTPEHDLTWTQISGLGWADEAMEAIDAVLASGTDGPAATSAGVISACLGVLIAWLKGASINGMKGGTEEKRQVVDWLEGSSIRMFIRNVASGDARPTLESDRLILAIVGLEALLPPSERLEAGDVGSPPASLLTLEDLSRLSTRTDLDRHIRYEILQRRMRADDNLSSTRALGEGLPLLTSFRPSEEPQALEMLDCLLRLDLGSISPDLSAGIARIGHPDSIVLLRPLLQHAILPDVTNITAPWPIEHLYLKATGSLRRPAPRQPDANGKIPPGLPLRPDWLFHPLDELLHSADSAALQQAPPDWDPSEVQIVRATLIFVRAALSAGVQLQLFDSEIIFGLMKVYMLEHQTGGMVNTGESELFRDDIVADCLKSIVHSLTTSSPTRSVTTLSTLLESSRSELEVDGYSPLLSSFIAGRRPAHAHQRPGLEAAAAAFLGVEPFYQFYADLVSLFENVSFGDPTLAQILLPPLTMNYSADYRKLVWSNPNVLRLLRTERGDVPIEAITHTERQPDVEPGPGQNDRTWIKGIQAYFYPAEQDPEVLNSYAQAVLRQWVKPEGQPFMWQVATQHLIRFLSQDKEAVRGEGGTQVLVSAEIEGDEAMERLKAGISKALRQSSDQNVVEAFGTLLKGDQGV